MKWTPQKWYCNNCGKEMFSSPAHGHGREFRTCSRDCYEEIQWKQILSMMGKEYYKKPLEKTDVQS